MRTSVIAGLLAATLMPTIASAQNRELRHDRQDIREEQRDVREARRYYRGDWRDYRRTRPDAFRGPAYAGPRGYAYRAVAPGYRFERGYYDRRYWIDPYRYRLPAAAYGRRWIRYGDDVALVDIRTGRAVTVYNRFFF